MRYAVLVGILGVYGCSIPVRLEMVQPPDVIRWQTEITARVNDHEHRLMQLESKTDKGKTNGE